MGSAVKMIDLSLYPRTLISFIKSLATNTSECRCKSGYHGRNCRFTGCQNNPCKNGGECFDAKTKFECDCLAGYTGKFCELTCPKGEW
jgi:EGF-like domain.